MAEEKPEYFTHELAKNTHKGVKYEIGGALAGAGLGAAVASSQNLKGWSFFGKLSDIAFVGWVIGWVASMWTERSANQTSALQLDSKMLKLEHENKMLKEAVTELGGHVVEVSDNHAEKVTSGRTDCGCRFKH